MCLGIPGKIIELQDKYATVDFGGTYRKINISLIDAKVNDWVIVHAGYAIQILDELEAEKTLELFNSILAQ